MRIAIVTPEYVTEHNRDGGLAGYLHRACVALRRLGHEPVVLVASGREQQLQDEDIEVHRVRVNHRFINKLDRLFLRRFPLDWLWQSWCLNRYLRRLERDRSFDVLHFSSYKAVALFNYSRTPAVIRLSSIQSLLHEANEVPRDMRRRLCEFLEIRAFSRVCALFAPSRFIAGEASVLTGRPVEVIESPWLPPTFDADPGVYRQHLEGKVYLLYFGTVSVLKGLAVIADALPSILEEWPDLNFVIAGKQQLYRGMPMVDYVRQRAGVHAERIHYLGKLERPRLAPVVAHAHAVVLPSRVENLSNACIESMGQGKIVIGTAETSFEQLIIDGENGQLCRRDDPDDLGRVIRKLLSMSNEQRKTMGDKARERISSLSPDKVISELVEFYGRVSGAEC